MELELSARPIAGIDVFGGIGMTHARFRDGSVSNGVDVSGNKLANAPSHTADLGVQFSRPVSPEASLTLRADWVRYGDYQDDDANTLGQEAYLIANFRGGVRGKRLFGEGWVRNAFDTLYIPIAFPATRAWPRQGLSAKAAPRGRSGSAWE